MNPSDTISPTDLWIAGCTGQTLSPALQSSTHYTEGGLVRSLFLSRLHGSNQQAMQPGPTEADEQRHWLGIAERSRREGLFTPGTTAVSQNSPPPAWTRVKAIASNQQWFALAASLAILGFGFTALMQQTKVATGDSAVIMRGDEAPQRLSAPANQTVAQLAAQIEAVLAQHQLPYRRVELPNGDVQIQAKIPKDSLARPALQTLGVDVPEHGRLNVLVGSR